MGPSPRHDGLKQEMIDFGMPLGLPEVRAPDVGPVIPDKDAE
jgi:hypothetical protein